MDTIATKVAKPGDGLVLPRVLSVVLWGLAVPFSVMSLAGIAMTVEGHRGGWAVIAIVLPLTMLIVWMARLLWSGRSIPARFIQGLIVGLSVLGVFATGVKGSWMEFLSLLAIGVATVPLFVTRSAPVAGKPMSPEELRDFG